MRLLIFLALIYSLPVWSQQQVVPQDFDRGKARLFTKITQAVSTPCCRNGIPVAFHDSGMAQYVRNAVIQSLRENKSEAVIMADLAKMTLGPNDEHLIFTVPENNSLGWIIWTAPAAFVFIGFGFVFYFYNKRNAARTKPSDNDLLENYRAYIRNQVDTPD